MGGATTRTMADTTNQIKCRWPFAHISIDVYGNVRPCCAWQLKDSRKSYNINKQPLQGYFDSNMYLSLTDSMKSNQYGAGCRDCYLEETTSMPEGTREVGFMKYSDRSQFEIHDMEIKFGNLCNQGCVMCSPMNSSVIAEERSRHHIRGHTVEWHHEQQQLTGADQTPWYLNDERLQEVADMAAQCKGQIKFRGGEPTVNNHLQNFLARLSNINRDLSIFVNTNGLTFTKKLEQELSKFNTVHLEVSIDGYGKVNDYVRWPSNWSKLEQNVDRMLEMPNTLVSVSTTVHTLNVGHMQPLCEWVTTKPIDVMIGNVVWYPDFLRPNLANQHHIDNFVDTAENFRSDQFMISKVLPTLNCDLDLEQQQEHRKKLLEYLADIDRVRGLRWQDHVSF